MLSKEWGETPERIGHGSATPAPAIEDWKGDEVTQDALYAMRYDPDGLAQGAFDARLERYGSKRLARSPAIDAGSDDAWGYDTTSTNPKVIDMGQPDIGYHYYRGWRTTIPSTTPSGIFPSPSASPRSSRTESRLRIIGYPILQLAVSADKKS